MLISTNRMSNRQSGISGRFRSRVPVTFWTEEQTFPRLAVSRSKWAYLCAGGSRPSVRAAAPSAQPCREPGQRAPCQAAHLRGAVHVGGLQNIGRAAGRTGSSVSRKLSPLTRTEAMELVFHPRCPGTCSSPTPSRFLSLLRSVCAFREHFAWLFTRSCIS